MLCFIKRDKCQERINGEVGGVLQWAHAEASLPHEVPAIQQIYYGIEFT
jgi:hypothetical protein